MTKKDWRKLFNKLWKHTYRTESGCKIIITTDLSLTSPQLTELKKMIEVIGFEDVIKRNRIVVEVAMMLIEWKQSNSENWCIEIACDYVVNPKNRRQRLLLSID